MTDTQDAAMVRHQNGAADRSLLSSYAAEHGLSGQKMYEALAKTIFPNERSATPEHVHALLVVAQQYGLNPFTRELYAFPGKNGGIVPVVSVDGWMKLVNSRPECEGVELSVEMDGRQPVSATCRIHRKGWKVPVEITEYHHEVARNTDPWKRQPVRMLRHRAFIQCARIAFGFGGIYEADEAARFSTDVSPEHREVESEVVSELQAQIDAEVASDEPAPTQEPEAPAEEYAPEITVAKLVAAFDEIGVGRDQLESELGDLDKLTRPMFEHAQGIGKKMREGATWDEAVIGDAPDGLFGSDPDAVSYDPADTDPG